MLTYEHIKLFAEWAAGAPTTFMFSLTFLIVGMASAVSALEFAAYRVTFYTLLAIGTFYLAVTQPDLPFDFMINLSTELFGALLLAILFSKVFEHMWSVFVIAGAMGVVSTLLLDGSTTMEQTILTNLSTEFIGAFVVGALLTHRHWIWNHARRENIKLNKRKRMRLADKLDTVEMRRVTMEYEHEQEMERAARDLAKIEVQCAEQREQLRLLKQQKKETLKRLKREVSEAEAQQSKREDWDAAVVIFARNKHRLRIKRAIIQQALKTPTLLKLPHSDPETRCCVVGKVNLKSTHSIMGINLNR